MKRQATIALDPLTGQELGLGHPGWGAVVEDFKRWKKTAPFMLDQAIEWRREALSKDDLDDHQKASLRINLEFALMVRYGVEPKGIEALRPTLKVMHFDAFQEQLDLDTVGYLGGVNSVRVEGQGDAEE